MRRSVLLLVVWMLHAGCSPVVSAPPGAADASFDAISDDQASIDAGADCDAGTDAGADSGIALDGGRDGGADAGAGSPSTGTCGSPDSGIPLGFEGVFHRATTGGWGAANVVFCSDHGYYFSENDCDCDLMIHGTWAEVDGGLQLAVSTLSAVVALSTTFDGFTGTGYIIQGEWDRGAVCAVCGGLGPVGAPVPCSTPYWGDAGL